MSEPSEKDQFERLEKEAWTLVKEYGLCRACKDRVNCSKMCEPKRLEILEKFFNCTDEFGNTEMYKLTFTQEEKIELDEFHDYEELAFRRGIMTNYYLGKKLSQYRHDISEDIFKKTGVRKPTPENSITDDINDYYAMRFREKGVCCNCVARPCCSEICKAKMEEVMAEEFNRDSGICKKCKLRHSLGCFDNCIDREEEIKKMEGKSGG